MADLVKVTLEDDANGGQLVLRHDDGTLIAAVTFGPITRDGDRHAYLEVFRYADGTDDSEESEYRWEG